MAALMSLLPQANAVSVGFSGIVTAVRQGTLTTGIAVGSVFNGTLTYDPTGLDMDSNPEVGKYMPSASAAGSTGAGSSAIDYWTLTIFTSAVPDRSNTIALLGCGVVPLVVIFELCRRNSGRADRSSSGLRRK